MASFQKAMSCEDSGSSENLARTYSDLCQRGKLRKWCSSISVWNVVFFKTNIQELSVIVRKSKNEITQGKAATS